MWYTGVQIVQCLDGVLKWNFEMKRPHDSDQRYGKYQKRFKYLIFSSNLYVEYIRLLCKESEWGNNNKRVTNITVNKFSAFLLWI